MGKIKKILENELVGGTKNIDVYPVTSVKAVYDENNERLDNILNRRGVVNISTDYNVDHIAEILTLEQAIAKVPSKDRVLGFQCKFLSEDGWKSYVFIGDSTADWTNKTKWNNYLTGTDVVQESGESEDKVMSQKAVSDKLSIKSAILNSQKAPVSLGKNLFNKNNSDIIIGYYIGYLGELVKNDSFIITHPIKVPVGKSVFSASAYDQNVYNNIYNSDGKLLETVLGQKYTNNHSEDVYIRFTCNASSWNILQVEEGTSATSYEEYTENREIKEHLNDLKVSLNDKIDANLTTNLFNKHSNDNVIGAIVNYKGEVEKSSNYSSFFATHKIPIHKGEKLTINRSYTQNVYAALYDINDNPIVVKATLSLEYVEGASYARFTSDAYYLSEVKVWINDIQPKTLEYSDKLDLKSEIEKNFIKKSLSKNLFNKNSSDNLIGYTYYSDGRLVKINDNILMLTHEIDIDCLQYYCNNAITENVYSAVFNNKHELLFTFQSKTLDCRNVPQARYVRFALYTSTKDTTQVEKGTAYTSYEDYTEFKGYEFGSTNNKPKKNILWLGTSIPNGSLSYSINYNGVELNNNYPQIVGYILNCNVNNQALGSSRLRVGNKKNVTEDNPLGWTKDAWWEGDVLPLMSTNAEKEDIINNWSKYYAKYNWKGAPETLSDYYKTLILSSTYEHRVLSFLNGTNPPDIIVIDHGYNDGVPVNSEGNFEEDINSTDRFTFFGAYNMLINTIRKYNSRIKIVQISHFISKYRGNEPNYTNLVKGQKAIADKNGVIFCPLYDIDGWDAEGYIKTYGKWVYDTGPHSSEKWATWKDNALSEAIDMTPTVLHCPDTVHPHSDMSGQSNIQLAEALAAWFSGNVF